MSSETAGVGQSDSYFVGGRLPRCWSSFFPDEGSCVLVILTFILPRRCDMGLSSATCQGRPEHVFGSCKLRVAIEAGGNDFVVHPSLLNRILLNRQWPRARSRNVPGKPHRQPKREKRNEDSSKCSFRPCQCEGPGGNEKTKKEPEDRFGNDQVNSEKNRKDES